MKNKCIKMVVLTLVISAQATADEKNMIEGAHKSSTRSFYSIIEKSSSTGTGIDTEIFEQTSESITNKRKIRNAPDITPQTVSPLAPKQHQWLNNQRGHGNYFDDQVMKVNTRPLGEYQPVVIANKEVLAVRMQMNKAAYDMNSTPYFKSPYQTEDAKLKRQLAAISQTVKTEQKRAYQERDSVSAALAKTSKEIGKSAPLDETAIAQQLNVSSRLVGYQPVVPELNATQQLFISSKAMQRQNDFYPGQMGAKDMKKLIRSTETVDRGKRKTLNEVLSEIFGFAPKSQVTPTKL